MKEEELIALLGYKAEDIITGITGVITIYSRHITGCIQVLIRDKNNDGHWFDVTRIRKIERHSEMSDYEKE